MSYDDADAAWSDYDASAPHNIVRRKIYEMSILLSR